MSRSMLPMMHGRIFQLIVGWVLITQSATVALRTGDVARRLTEKDIAGIQLLLKAGESPWLLNADFDLDELESIDAYLPPTVTTSVLRRGTLVMVRRQINRSNKWTVARIGSYAQVAIPGRSFDQIESDQDINRPFPVIGSFDNDDLVGLVQAVRSHPIRSGGFRREIRSWPILAFQRRGDNSVRVSVLGPIMSGQTITVRQGGKDWVIDFIGMWIA